MQRPLQSIAECLWHALTECWPLFVLCPLYGLFAACVIIYTEYEEEERKQRDPHTGKRLTPTQKRLERRQKSTPEMRPPRRLAA